MLVCACRVSGELGQRGGLVTPESALQVDGFPPPGEVLTVYVAHDIQAQHEDPLVLDYLAQDPQIKGKGLDKARCQKALEDIGFDDSRLSLNISTLSGATPSLSPTCIPLGCDLARTHTAVLSIRGSPGPGV